MRHVTIVAQDSENIRTHQLTIFESTAMSWKPANAELEEGPWRSTVGRDVVSTLMSHLRQPETRSEAEDLAKLEEEVDRAASSEVPKLEAPFTELDLSIMQERNRLFKIEVNGETMGRPWGRPWGDHGETMGRP